MRAIVAIVGSDRPGLTRSLADAIVAANGNWLESHLARLADHYVGSVLIELPEQSVDVLRQELEAIDKNGLLVSVVPVEDRPEAEYRFEAVEIVAQDRAGIIREVASALAALNVNIDAIETRLEGGPWSGGTLFRAKIRLGLPPGMELEPVQNALESLSADLMVDFCQAPTGD